jgi:hypothetical protein
VIRIAAYVAGIAVIAGLLCTPVLWGADDGRSDLPWTARWDTVLGTSPVGLTVVLLLGLAGAVLGGHLGATARQRPPAYPPTDAPPAGIGPAQAVHLLEQRVPWRAFVGTLLHAAERGAVTLDRLDDGWRVTVVPGQDGAVDEVTHRTVRLLTGAEGRFTVGRRSVDAGQRLEEAIDGLDRSVKEWGTRSGNLSSSGVGGLGAVLAVVGLALVAVCLAARPFGMSMIGIIPGAFAVCGISMIVAGAGRRRTRRGRALWSQVGGFKRVLETPSSRQRFDFAGREELYTAYLPWAVAFGCARQWAQKYRTAVGSEPPAPTYLPPYAGAHTVDHVDAMVHQISSTLRSAVSSYAATQRSSAGGGGFGAGRTSW